jgi:hypothetical protein
MDILTTVQNYTVFLVVRYALKKTITVSAPYFIDKITNKYVGIIPGFSKS